MTAVVYFARPPFVGTAWACNDESILMTPNTKSDLTASSTCTTIIAYQIKDLVETNFTKLYIFMISKLGLNQGGVG